MISNPASSIAIAHKTNEMFQECGFKAIEVYRTKDKGFGVIDGVCQRGSDEGVQGL